jgi:hypothetical protein
MQLVRPKAQGDIRNGFLALQIAGGQVGLPIIILTFILSKNVHRHPTLINFCITWSISSIAYCLLIYSGQKAGHDGSPTRLCIIQAAMIEGGTPMAATACLAVIIQIWRTFQSSEPSILRRIPQSVKTIVTLGLPYVVFFIFTTTTAVFEHKYSFAVNGDNGLYCTFTWKPFYTYVGPLFCLVMLIIILGFELAVVINLYRLHKLIHTIFPLATQRAPPSLFIRVLIFTSYSIITFITCILFLSDSSSHWGYLMEASIPLAVVVVFGTQKDLFLTWSFWKPKKTEISFDEPVIDQASPASPQTSLASSGEMV